MANQADKKQQKIKESQIPFYTQLFYAFTLIKLLFIIIQFFQGTLTKLDIFLFVVFTAANTYSYQMICKSLDLGVSYSFYFDVFCVVNTFQMISIYTNKIFYLLYGVS